MVVHRLGAISRLHAFPKPEQHLTQQTLSGGIVTLLGVLTAATLFFHELSFFLTPSKDYKMAVDTTARGGKLPIFFDITFPALPCQVLELDTVDSSGEADMDVHGADIHKTRLDSRGYRISSEKVDHTKKKKKKQQQQLPKGGPKRRLQSLPEGLIEGGGEALFGDTHGDEDKAEDKDNDQDKGMGKDKDKDKGEGKKEEEEEEGEGNLPVLKGDSDGAAQDPWQAIMSLFDTSGLENTVHEMQAALDRKEGCRLTGKLSVSRVAGNLHVSVHVTHFYVIQRVFPTSERVNMSHFIHTFGFGAQYPGRVNPLDGVQRMIHPLGPGEKEDNNPHQIGTFKYFLKVVPTVYKYISGHAVDTNQYSVSEYFMPVDVKHFGVLPALNFVYDLSPITVEIREERENLFSFITRLCAVLGGAFALTGMLNRVVFASLKQVGPPKRF